MHLEFGNPEHIKLAQKGARFAKLLEKTEEPIETKIYEDVVTFYIIRCPECKNEVQGEPYDSDVSTVEYLCDKIEGRYFCKGCETELTFNF